MKRNMRWLVVVLLTVSLLVSGLVVLAEGPDPFAARGGVPDVTLPERDPQDLTEGFENIGILSASGWFTRNNSSPLGTTGWFQGNSAVFPAQAGAATSYIGANFNNTAGGTGTISNWLLTPVLNLNDGDTVSFWTRVPTGGGVFPDRLEVRMSLNGSSTNVGTLATDVGDFTTLLLSVNPTLTTTGYPEVWTQFVINISGVATPTDGRIAFRYYVTGAGPTGNNSNYIGIDSFDFTDAMVAAPEITLEVSPASQNIPFGGDANFSVTVTNTGNVTLTNVTVTADVADCNNVIGDLAPGAANAYNCTDVGVTASYTNTVVVTTTYNGQTGPSTTVDVNVVVEPPTSVSLSSFEGNTLISPVMLVLLVAIVLGLGALLYRRLNAG